MNARDYKIFRAGHYYHIFNRGNNKENIFLDPQDYLVFLNRIKLALGIISIKQSRSRIRVKPLPEGSFSFLAYCLMPNHFHFLIRQNTSIGIEKLLAKICTSYVKYFNLKYERVGNLFQDAFKAKLVESDSYAKYLSAYIHNNPENLFTYEFSSFPDYVLGRQGKIVEKSIILGMFNNKLIDYKNFVLGYSSKDEINLKNLLFEE